MPVEAGRELYRRGFEVVMVALLAATGLCWAVACSHRAAPEIAPNGTEEGNVARVQEFPPVSLIVGERYRIGHRAEFLAGCVGPEPPRGLQDGTGRVFVAYRVGPRPAIAVSDLPCRVHE